MAKMYLLTSALFLPAAAAAQLVCAMGPGASAYKAGSDQRPTADAMQLANRVNAAAKTVCASHCPELALFRNSTAPNAMLLVDSSQAKVVYSPQFFAAAYDSLGDAAILAVVAHELGHALDDTLGAAWIKTGWHPELRADAWGACLLARMDLSAHELNAGLTALATYPPPAAPAWNSRLPVIRTGYTQCGGNGAAFDREANAAKRK
ncbi:MAG: hypothetical protein JO323_08565 [Acidobacteriia bacterium]|nr:hypothetical protein [Terriglobia bacterium]